LINDTKHDSSEQGIPLLGLSELSRILDPQTTFEKLVFLVMNAKNAHIPTTFISFSSLSILVGLRWVKNKFKNTWWIYRIPEVLLVVLISTG
jgi:MFS superfamily sulfate permease-like transporter